MNAAAKKLLHHLAMKSSSNYAVPLINDFLQRAEENEDWKYSGKRKTSDGKYVYNYLEADALLSTYAIVSNNFGRSTPEALLFKTVLSAFELNTEFAQNDVKERLLSMNFDLEYSCWVTNRVEMMEKWEETAIPLVIYQEDLQRSGRIEKAAQIQKMLDLGDAVYSKSKAHFGENLSSS